MCDIICFKQSKLKLELNGNPLPQLCIHIHSMVDCTQTIKIKYTLYIFNELFTQQLNGMLLLWCCCCRSSLGKIKLYFSAMGFDFVMFKLTPQKRYGAPWCTKKNMSLQMPLQKKVPLLEIQTQTLCMCVCACVISFSTLSIIVQAA